VCEEICVSVVQYVGRSQVKRQQWEVACESRKTPLPCQAVARSYMQAWVDATGARLGTSDTLFEPCREIRSLNLNRLPAEGRALERLNGSHATSTFRGSRNARGEHAPYRTLELQESGVSTCNPSKEERRSGSINEQSHSLVRGSGNPMIGGFAQANSLRFISAKMDGANVSTRTAVTADSRDRASGV